VKEKLEALIREMDASGILYAEAVSEFKKRFIVRVMTRCHGNQCKTAREMQMHRNTLSRTIEDLEMDAELVRLKLKRPVQKGMHCRKDGEPYPVKSVPDVKNQQTKAMGA
jgi:Fis family transcriptional regulator